MDQNNNTVGARIEGLLLSNGGTVCDDSFSDNSADAICREMGFIGRYSWRSGELWNSFQTNVDITLDEVSCSSGEWNSCTYSFEHNCHHREDVFLKCDGIGKFLLAYLASGSATTTLLHFFAESHKLCFLARTPSSGRAISVLTLNPSP